MGDLSCPWNKGRSGNFRKLAIINVDRGCFVVLESSDAGQGVRFWYIVSRYNRGEVKTVIILFYALIPIKVGGG